MPRVDWAYLRGNCETCEKAQVFLDRSRIVPAAFQDARKDRIQRAEAVRLARSSGRIVATKGRSVVTLDPAKDKPSDAEIAALVVGPSGNLRAPALRVGTTLLVGFDEACYRSALV